MKATRRPLNLFSPFCRTASRDGLAAKHVGRLLALGLLSVMAFCAPVAELSAQGEATFSQYVIQPFLLNPALVGFEEQHQLRINHRSAWVGLPEGPRTSALSYNGHLSPTLGLGAQVFTETIAGMQRLAVRGAYAFRHPVGDAWDLAGGFALVVSNNRLRSGVVGSFGFEEDDPIAQAALDSRSSLDASIGFFAKHRSGAYGGLTFPNLVAANLSERSPDAEGPGRGGLQHFALRLGHDAYFPQRKMHFRPSVLLSRTEGSPFRADINGLLSFRDDQFLTGARFQVGAGSSAGLIVGARWDQLRFYYGYDLSFGAIQTYSSGSHELTVGYDLSRRRSRIGAI